MDKIILKNLAFYGYHGVLAEENTLGQKFYVDIELYLNLKKAGMSDNIEDTISYAQVYEKVKNIVENKRFNLLEALAENIALTILDHDCQINQVFVQLRKPEAPVNGIYDYFAVEIRRKQNA